MSIKVRDRAFEFACRVVRLYWALMRKRGNAFAANQMVRAGTGIGSNLEEAEAAQSRADFISKVRIALKESRETHYWLRIVERTEMVPPARVHPLVEEANELVSILTKMVKTATSPKRPSPSPPAPPATS